MPEPPVMRRRSWSHQDLRILVDRWGNVSLARLAEMLGREPGKVKAKAEKLGLILARGKP